MSETVDIRPALAAEIKPIAAIWDESWVSTGVPSPEHLSLDELADRLQGYVEDGADLFAIAQSEALIGLILIDPAAQILSQLFLSSTAQNHGIGQLCMRFIKARMPDGFTLTVAEQNRKAIRFYERAGLVQEARIYREDYQRFDLRFRWTP